MNTTDTNEICRKMNDVRCSLGDDVEEIVESARTLTDWRHYVKTYPWACLAGAAAIGYVIVPRRIEIISPSAATMQKLAKRNKLVVNTKPKPQAKGGVTGLIFGLFANALARGAMGYLGQQAGKMVSGEAKDKEGAK